MSEETGSTGTNLMLFLLGAAVGAVAVALLTPKTGPELRADLKDLAAQAKDKVKQAAEEFCPGAGDPDPVVNGDPT